MHSDLVIKPRWIIPVVPYGVTLTDHVIVVRNGRIAQICEAGKLNAAEADVRIVELPDHVLIPGLINTHTHAAMSLMRGLADDLPLMRWLNEHIWPTEAKHVSHEFVLDGTRLAIAEMIRGGITCFNDMYFFADATAEAAAEAGMRASIGMIALEFPTSYASDAQDYLEKGLAMRDQWKGKSNLSFCLAPHAPYTVADTTFERIGVLAEKLDLPIHMHVHETRDEVDGSATNTGRRPIARLASLGLLSPRLIAVHAVHLEANEISMLANHGCHVAHCPSSNLKLASGIAPVAQLLEAGVNVALGTDGAASNNRLDMFEEMRLAALLAKAAANRADVLPAHRALELATYAGARALALDRETGSLEVGKCADLTAVNLNSLELSPCYDPASHLVYSAGRHDVTHVWIDGKAVLEDKRLVSGGQQVSRAAALRWAALIQPLG
jgi:5-methylthioadenosine/S-adenosylhomocysteine deaminase